MLFGFPLNNNVMHVLNICTLYAKYYIYIQRLFNSTLDLNVCLTQLKQALKIEENICKKNNNGDNFFKFHFNTMINYNENNACNYVYMNICKLPVII